jgi:endonuclease/exonuclease/phosphatase family metal-dependent hydrolase
MEVHFFPALEIGEGKYGIALATRDRIDTSVEELPRLGQEEPRVAVVARWREITVVTTHLSRDPEARRAQTEALAAIVTGERRPWVVLGDLNQSSADLHALIDVGLVRAEPRRSLLARLSPTRGIDHILVSSELEARGGRIVPTFASDHFPVYADLGRPTTGRPVSVLS